MYFYKNVLLFYLFFCSGRSKKKDHCLNTDLHPLEETEPCPCEEFLSQPFGNWSNCILSDPSTAGSLKVWMSQREVKECGRGLRYRAVACVDQLGHLVDPTLCTESGMVNVDLTNLKLQHWWFDSISSCIALFRLTLWSCKSSSLCESGGIYWLIFWFVLLKPFSMLYCWLKVFLSV